MSGRSDATSEESLSPTGPLELEESALENVPEIDDLGISALTDAGQDWEEVEEE